MLSCMIIILLGREIKMERGRLLLYDINLDMLLP